MIKKEYTQAKGNNKLFQISDLKKEIKILRNNQQKKQQQINQLLGKKRMKTKFKKIRNSR